MFLASMWQGTLRSHNASKGVIINKKFKYLLIRQKKLFKILDFENLPIIYLPVMS